MLEPLRPLTFWERLADWYFETITIPYESLMYKLFPDKFPEPIELKIIEDWRSHPEALHAMRDIKRIVYGIETDEEGNDIGFVEGFHGE